MFYQTFSKFERTEINRVPTLTLIRLNAITANAVDAVQFQIIRTELLLQNAKMNCNIRQLRS